jgi:hypothetical protein
MWKKIYAGTARRGVGGGLEKGILPLSAIGNFKAVFSDFEENIFQIFSDFGRKYLSNFL